MTKAIKRGLPRDWRKLPEPGAETVIARDKYRNKILLHGNTPEDGGFDLQTDGRIVLTPELARDLASKLWALADVMVPRDPPPSKK